jgi:hypothetical protein
MPTFRHGKGGVFKLDNSAGSLVDVSSVVEQVSLSYSVETGETTQFGNNSKTYITGLQDATVSISGKYDATFDAQFQGVVAALMAGTLTSASFEYGPEGSTSTRIKYSGEGLVTSYEVSASVGDVVSYSLELQCTGAITRATWP